MSNARRYYTEAYYQVKRYERYCALKDLDPTFPMEPQRLADYLNCLPLNRNTKNTMVSQLARLVENPKGWSRQIRKYPAVRKAIESSTSDMSLLSELKRGRFSNEKQLIKKKGDNGELPPILATVCKRRRLPTEHWTVQHISF